MKKLLFLVFLISQFTFAVDAAEIVRPGDQGKDLAMTTSKTNASSGGNKGDHDHDEEDDKEGPDSGGDIMQAAVAKYLYLIIGVVVTFTIAFNLYQKKFSKE